MSGTVRFVCCPYRKLLLPFANATLYVLRFNLAYFSVWSSCAFVVDTSVWWIHDWRKRVLAAICEQEKEYHKIQQQVLERSRREEEEEAAKVREHSEVDDDDLSMNANSIEGQPIPDMAGT